MAAATQVDQDQHAVAGVGAQLRREAGAHVGHRREGRDDQRHRRHHWRCSPSCSQLVFMDSESLPTGMDRPAAWHSSLTADTVSYSAASWPGTPQAAIQLADNVFQARHVGGGWCCQGLGHGHAARGRRVEHGDGRAFAHGHGFAAEAFVVGQRHGAVGHRHLPRTDHLVAAGQPAHGAVADGDEEGLVGHGGVAQHAVGGFGVRSMPGWRPAGPTRQAGA